MKVETRWGCECKRYFIDTGMTTRKGTAVRKPVDFRKMFISGRFVARQGDISHITALYKITLVKRKAGNKYCVMFQKSPDRWWHDKTPIHESELKWVREDSLTRDEFLVWLKFRVANPLACVVEMETCPVDTATKLAA